MTNATNSLRAWRYVSCGAEKLYDDRSFPESLDLFSRMVALGPAAEFIKDLFPAFSYNREIRMDEIHCSASFAQHLERSRKSINCGLTGAASSLFLFDRAIILNRVLYVQRDKLLTPLFETHRPLDRDSSPLGSEDELKAPVWDHEIAGPTFFMGSAGCFNYGHWLTDDLPRLNAFWTVRSRHPNEHIRVLVTRHGGAVDIVREQSIKFMLCSDKNYSIYWINRGISQYFEILYFASPVSYPGNIKSPDALHEFRALATTAIKNKQAGRPPADFTTTGRTGLRLFIDRSATRTRSLTNGEDLFSELSKLGFERYTLEDMSFEDQVWIFSRASIVVGNMGAGMVNTVFSKPKTQVIYLIPEGWDDAFFWDLASVMNHRHEAVYGALIGEHFFDGFTVDAKLVLRLVERAISLPPA